MNKKLRRFSKAEDNKLRVLWASHMPERLIAKRLGHSRGTIRWRVIKLGLPSSRRELWDKELA